MIVHFYREDYPKKLTQEVYDTVHKIVAKIVKYDYSGLNSIDAENMRDFAEENVLEYLYDKGYNKLPQEDLERYTYKHTKMMTGYYYRSYIKKPDVKSQPKEIQSMDDEFSAPIADPKIDIEKQAMEDDYSQKLFKALRSIFAFTYNLDAAQANQYVWMFKVLTEFDGKMNDAINFILKDKKMQRYLPFNATSWHNLYQHYRKINAALSNKTKIGRENQRDLEQLGLV